MASATLLRTDHRVVKVEAGWPCRRLLSNPGWQMKGTWWVQWKCYKMVPILDTYSFKAELMNSAERLDVGYETKKRIRGDPRLLSLSTCNNNEVVINWDRGDWGKSRFGRGKSRVWLLETAAHFNTLTSVVKSGNSNGDTDPKLHMEIQGIQNRQSSLKKEEHSGRTYTSPSQNLSRT